MPTMRVMPKKQTVVCKKNSIYGVDATTGATGEIAFSATVR